MGFPAIPGYEIQEEIGRDGASVVYRAWQTSQGRTVALQVLLSPFARNSDVAASFLREAGDLAAHPHPNIAAVYDFGRTDGAQPSCYVATEIVHGRTIIEVLTVRCPPPHDCAQVIANIAAALDHAHRHGVIHRNITSSDITLCADGKAKISRFGFAGDGPAAAGDPTYLSPEQCKGMPATARSDQYSLGVALYELLTGRPPFIARDADALRHQQASHAPPALPAGRADITPRMEAAVMRALSKMPEMRYPTLGEFARDFAAACREQPGDILVGAAPGADPNLPSAPVSLVGGETFAAGSRSVQPSVYMSAVRGAHESRRRRSLVVVMLLLLLGGGAAAAYLTYFRTPPAAASAKPKTAKKTTKTHKQDRTAHSNRRSSHGEDDSPTSVPAASSVKSEPGDKKESASEEHSADTEKPANAEKPSEEDNGKKDDTAVETEL